MSKQQQMEKLMDALLVLKEIDLAIAPIIPSVRMCEIGAEIGDVSPEIAKRIYTIMLLNSQNTSEGNKTIIH